MSLIADALNKLKKDQDEETGEEMVIAPPALKNAVVNTKKYKDFIAKSELRDINGKRPNLKGFAAVSAIILVIIAATVYFFLKKENANLVNKATVSSGPASAESTPSSLGSPYKKPQEDNAKTYSGGTAETAKQQEQAPLITDNSGDMNTNVNKNVDKPAGSFFDFELSKTPDKNTANQPVKEQNKNTKSDKKPDTQAAVPAARQNNTKNAASEQKQPAVIKDAAAINEKSSGNSIAASETALYNKYISAGNEAKNNKNYASAIEYYKHALELRKDNNLILAVAVMYLELKNPNMAFQTVVSNSLNNPDAVSSITGNMIKNGYSLEASKMLQYANTLEKSPSILFVNGYFYDMEKQYDKAAKYYGDVLDINPNDAAAAYYSARAFENMKDYKSAVSMYERVLNINNADTDMKNQAAKRIDALKASL